MTIKEIFLKFQGNPDFREWEKKNSNAYLVHFFFMDEPGAAWQMGHYDDDTKAMTSFTLEKDSVKIQEEKDVFQKEPEKIRPIIIDDVKRDFEEIKKAALAFQKTDYPGELPLKAMYVLQNLKDYGQIWNVTIFTRTFKTLNMKFDSSSGELLEHNLAKLFDMEPGQGGKEANIPQ